MADFKSRDPTRQSISAEAFNNGNALSFEQQPALRELFDVLSDNLIKVTIIVGAGVSVDAGFPGWSKLVNRLADRITKPTTRRLAKMDSSDGPMRHAESIFRMIHPDEPDSDAGVLRDALYGGMPKTEPGPIALAIASVWNARSNRINLITTNFDDVLEEALEQTLGERQPESFSLYAEGADEDRNPDDARQWGGVSAWEAFRQENPDRPAVLHLHGMVRRRDDPLRPVVLSESHFLWHGPRAREVIRNELRSSAVVFVGVSLNDPDLVGPLWDMNRGSAASRPQCFVLHVPNNIEGARSAAEARSYTLEKYDYMETGLGVLPIFLKSYSQLLQVFIEMRLQLEEPYYVEPEGAKSLVYGRRYTRILDSAYEKVTGSGQDSETRLSLQTGISQALRDILQPGQVVGDMLTLAHKSIQRRALVKLKHECLDFDILEENFGLFLWLRVRGENGEPAPYALSLAASSTYVHRDAWSFQRSALIEPDSTVPAADSVFSGLILFRNLPPAGQFTLWRGVMAMPLRVTGTSSKGIPTDVTIGAIGPNSTHYVEPNNGEFQSHVSSLAILRRSRDDTDRLRNALGGSVTKALGNDLEIMGNPVSAESN